MNQKQILIALGIVVLVVVGILIYSNSNKVNNTSDQSNSVERMDSLDRADETTLPTNTANTNAAVSTPATQTPSEPTMPDGNDVQVFEIAYDGKAYTPAILSIKNGDVVVFKNNSDEEFWPASAQHPNHLEYPEFDPKKPVAAGQTWQFKFTKSGIWGFHDHLTPRAFGKITVR